jgi:hypothetical protein
MVGEGRQVVHKPGEYTLGKCALLYVTASAGVREMMGKQVFSGVSGAGAGPAGVRSQRCWGQVRALK